ncbi:hypothetical protein OE88DRAFT_1146926 [Heliocybe sulcata]|nr:hypothetical protein OE88DRAFT_1146926 [Heliocybe sulcata]
MLKATSQGIDPINLGLAADRPAKAGSKTQVKDVNVNLFMMIQRSVGICLQAIQLCYVTTHVDDWAVRAFLQTQFSGSDLWILHLTLAREIRQWPPEGQQYFDREYFDRDGADHVERLACTLSRP